MPKADAWREKNRLAQKAFRQRQKVCTAALAHSEHIQANKLYQHQKTEAQCSSEACLAMQSAALQLPVSFALQFYYVSLGISGGFPCPA